MLRNGRKRAFVDAVANGAHARVRELLAADAALVRVRDAKRFGASPLNLAAERDDRVMVDLLLDAGADPNAKSDWWAGPFGVLHTAHDPGLAEHLVARGARVDAHAAARFGWMDRLRVILDENPGAVRERGGDGKLPLHFAATPEVVDLLLERGAEIDARDVDHVSTPAQWASRERPAVARHLLERGATGDVFMYAAIGDTERLGGELDQNPSRLTDRITRAEFPSPGSRGGHIYTYALGMDATPLHVAARCDRPESARLLLARGADVNIVGDYDDATPLHIAAWNGSVRAADVLIDAGADIERNSGALHGTSPVCWAIVAGSVPMVKRLFERGARFLPYYEREARDGLASTQRHTAASDDDFRAIIQLVAQAKERPGRE